MSEETPASDIHLEEKLKLQDDFSSPSFQEWKERVEQDLKGASYEKRLITRTYDGISLNPIYTSEDLKKTPFTDSLPGSGYFVRGNSVNGYHGNSWDVNQEIITEDVSEFNEAILDALKKGQNCVNLKLDTATKLGMDADYAETEQVGDIGLSISAINSMKRALDNVDLSLIPLYVEAGFNNIPFMSLVSAHCQGNNIKISELSGAITSDPVAHLAEYGELNVSMDYIFDMMKNSLGWTLANAPNIRSIGISTIPFINAGCSSVQELGISIATLVYYLNELIERGSKGKDIFNSFQFNFGISTNYFTEIAKFRAAKVLISNIAENYDISPEKVKLNIAAKTSTFNDTSLDPYVNMLRSTTQTFSAILGGVDSITTNPFDEVLRKSDQFSRRIARNTHTILREESHLDSVIDPGGGSYYIETLTEELAKSAWEFFKKIEKEGGIFQALNSEFIQKSIDEVSDLRRKDINKRKSVIVGTNMFADINEKKLEERETDQILFQKRRSEYLEKYRLNGTREKHEAIMEILNSISSANDPEIIDKITEAYLIGSTIGEITSALNSAHKEDINISKLAKWRASEGFEELRNSALEHRSKFGKLPKVFLANFGSIREYKARADFSKGFFEVG
ncbi:MAG: acyl-CoA mutase large subunit family protein, partial [Melioribacteraceae bacterium]|nr:acyl-CoA mutase large subunit family protein [Melioribacteraceae bacterium]